MLIILTDKVNVKFDPVCPKCEYENNSNSMTLYDLVEEVGCPVCGECGRLLEVESYVEIEEEKFIRNLSTQEVI